MTGGVPRGRPDRMVLLALLLTGAVLAAAVAAAPALADISGGDPPDYVLEEDGTVVIDGDLSTDCPSFATTIPRADADPDLEQARRVLELCRRGGFLPSGGSALTAPTPQQPSAQVSQRDQQPSPAGAVLPSTGGPDLPIMPAPPGGALLVVLVALGLAVRRRQSSP